MTLDWPGFIVRLAVLAPVGYGLFDFIRYLIDRKWGPNDPDHG